ncbi:MAG: Glycosyltransferase [Parcubacteria group bacterium GW2011_GWA2_47_9]|nr:MAG: Glycosyltransferase [Parcubacteria group bacterium GW2011_GWA2_47_9]
MTKLLIITQKVDSSDPILGFFHRWLEEFAKNVEKLTVICLEKGEYNLPENVKVLSLGKENLNLGSNPSSRSLGFDPRKTRKLKYLFNFYRHIWRERKNYDVVFVHMNPEYVILGWADWKILGKKIALWYVHKSVDFKLRLAEKLADKIFTASKESFRLPSKKVEIVGHGIDINKFSILNFQFSNKLRIITAGRIAPVKNLEMLIKLKLLVKQKGLENTVSFVGPISYPQIADFYHEGDIFVNLSETGSLDKAVLEAMACGLSVITSNEAFKNILPPRYFLDQKTPEALAEKLQKLLGENRPNLELRDIVVQNHGLDKLIKKIVSAL